MYTPVAVGADCPKTDPFRPDLLPADNLNQCPNPSPDPNIDFGVEYGANILAPFTKPGLQIARILGASAPILALKRAITQVAPADATVLILGERGTGKELVAEALHAGSRRHHRPCVKVNCAALPPELLASELFGHERGAFTGATERRPGLLAAAHGGTLVLKEVGDLSAQGQAMLLRFLQGREVRPWGRRRPSRSTSA